MQSVLQEKQQMLADYWNLDRVIRWLEANDFKSAIEVFRARNICGRTFLEVDMSFLMTFQNELSLSYSEKRRLAHSIKALRGPDDHQSNNMQNYNNQRNLHTSSSTANLNTRYNNAPRYAVPTPSTGISSDSVTPLIPERTSSNNEQVLDWVKSFNIPKRPIANSARLNSNARLGYNISSSNLPINSNMNQNTNNGHYPISPSSPRVGDDGQWKFVRRRPNNGQIPINTSASNVNQHYMDYPTTVPAPLPPQQQQRQQFIHVTKDSDTFHSLQVTGMHDPRLIKNTILRKLSLEGKCERYLFFHENGNNSDVALTDSELSQLCQNSDHSSPNRILVKPADYALEQYRSYSKDGTNCYDFAPKANYSRRYANQQYIDTRPVNNYNDMASNRSRYDLNNGMVSPINGSNLYMAPNQDGYEDNKEDSGYFERSGRTSRKQSMDVDGGALSSNLTLTESTNRKTPPLWTVTPQSQRSSTSSTDTQRHHQHHQRQASHSYQQQGLGSLSNTSETTLTPSIDDPTIHSIDPNALWPVHQGVPDYTNNEPPTSNASGSSLWAVPPKQQIPSSTPSLWAVAPKQQQKETLNASPALWAIPPKQKQEEAPNSTPSLWAVPPVKQQEEILNASPALWAVPPKQDTDEPIPPSTSLWAVPPKKQQSEEVLNTPASLWAVPPLNQQNEEVLTTPASLWAVPPKQQSDDSSSAAPSLWAVPPQQQSEEATPATTSLWAVPPSQQDNSTSPQKMREVKFLLAPQEDAKNSPSGRSVASAPALEDGIESISLSDPPPPGQLQHNNSTQQLHINTDVKNDSEEETSSPLSSPSGATSDVNDEENWAERPSVERLYKDIDKYLPGHDLDKEIIVEQAGQNSSTPTATLVTALPPGRRLGGHKKSIRNVAKEAHRNWRNAVNVIRANNLLRRRSTKMWHRAVEQVKPGMKVSTGDSNLPKSKKLQWIRGELIGKGSFGRVYHALNVEAGEWIAVKQVDLPTTKADYNNPQLREIKDALFREISLLEDLDNEYIVQYLGYDVDEEEGHINIFLEYVPGGSIASCLAKTGKFEIPLVQFFTRQILMGLAYLHNRNVLHRDIKAGNILLDQNGICKITDFGLSKLSGQDKAYDPHSNNSVMRGTVFWMAPEVVKGTNYNAKIDIWSLGCTVIEMLTGKHPWLDLNMLAALYSLGKYQAPPIPEDIPEDARDFLTKCFTINPDERPTAEQLLTHEFVQPDPDFEFRKYMKKAEIERRASRRLQPIAVEN